MISRAELVPAVPEETAVPRPLVEGNVAQQMPPVEHIAEPPNLAALSVQLAKDAQSTRKGIGAFESQAYASANVLPSLLNTATIYGNIAANFIVDNYPITAFNTGVLTGLVTTTHYMRHWIRGRKKAAVAVPNGYSLQCLRAANPTPEVEKGEVVVAVHPRRYDNEPEPARLATQRLGDALKVVAGAKRKGEPAVDKVIIAESTARAAGLTLTGGRPYKDVVADFLADVPVVPYDPSERAVVVSVAVAKELAERAGVGKGELLTRVLQRLGNEVSLRGGNDVVLRALHDMLRHEVMAEAPGARIKEKRMLELKGESGGRAVAWDGSWHIGRESTLGAIDPRKDPFNPRILFRTARFREVDTLDLDTLAGGEATMHDIDGKLDTGEYSRMQLIRVALGLLKTQQEARGAAVETPQGVDDVPLALGAEPELIRLAPASEQPRYGNSRRRFMARVALSAVLGFSVAQGIELAIDHYRDVTSASDSTTSCTRTAPDLFKVEEHGQQPSTAYWPQTTNYEWTEEYGWRHGNIVVGSVDRPSMFLHDPSSPHLTVESITNQDMLAVPVAEHMTVGAARAVTGDGNLLDVTLLHERDGTTLAQVAQAGCKYYRLEYDLVNASADLNAREVRADRPLKVEGNETISLRRAMRYPGANYGVVQQATEVRDTFVYDADPEIERALSHVAGPSEYVSRVYSMKRCMCLQCNGVVAMVQSRLHPDRNLALVTGWTYADGSGSYGYLGDGVAHAWLSDGEEGGEPIVDATATRQDDETHLPRAGSLEELDAGWNKRAADAGVTVPTPSEKKEPLVTLLYSMLGVCAVGVVGAEMRSRSMERAVRNYLRWDGWTSVAMDIEPNYAADLIRWQAYGQATGVIPVPDRGPEYRREQADNIPKETLHEIKRGGFIGGGQLTPTQQRGLRHAAGAILRDQRYNSWHDTHPKKQHARTRRTGRR